MADTLQIFGTEYTNVAGIIATTPSETDLTYIRPQGTKSISANGTGIDVAAYASVDVSVSGSLDMPTFTETWSNDWETFISRTCDKTYQECHSYYADGKMDALLISKTQDESEVYESFIQCTSGGGPTVPLKYTFFNMCVPRYDIVYNPNGVIEVAEPSFLVETLNVTQNGTYQPSRGYIQEVNVNVPSTTPTLQNKTVSPSESQQSIQADSGYDGLDAVTVNAISSTYVGSGITRRDSDDLTVSGATVSVPAGYYSAAAQKSVASGSASAPSSISDTSASVTTGTNTLTLTKTVSVTPVVSAGYVSSGTATNSSVSLTASIPVNPTVTASGATVTIPAGYYTEQTTKSVSSGSATGPSSLSGSSATVSTGTNTLTLTKTGVTTTPTVSAGYVSSATASTATVTLTASVTTKAAATITPGTTNQTIAAGTYLTGTQTIAGDADLVASNIISTANIFGVQGSVVVQNYYTGSSAPASSLGSNGDLYLQS